MGHDLGAAAAMRNPPVVASLVTEKPSRVRAEDTAPLSSLLTIARISFIKELPFLVIEVISFILP